MSSDKRPVPGGEGESPEPTAPGDAHGATDAPRAGAPTVSPTVEGATAPMDAPGVEAGGDTPAPTGPTVSPPDKPTRIRDRGVLRVFVDEASGAAHLVVAFTVPAGLRDTIAAFLPAGCLSPGVEGGVRVRILLEADGERRTWSAPAPIAAGGRTGEHVVADASTPERIRLRVAKVLAVRYWGRATPSRIDAVLEAGAVGRTRAARIADDAAEVAFARWLEKRADGIYRGRARRVALVPPPDPDTVTAPDTAPRTRTPWKRRPRCLDNKKHIG